MTEIEIERYLAKLSDSKLVELLYRSLAERNSGCDKLLLAETYKAENSGAAHVALVAIPPSGFPITSNERDDFLENGYCRKCEIEVTAIAKEANCPVCNSFVGLT
ncbi:hypothetical protein FLL45_17525 [Aliikangiella marina]|uniref:Uncharacterized protein n=1 Tax=Aliikangiella marina TaxID=1712262 RepID=A0A545T474_9GAMM|nr:hypothetical protein [Aliikangiella marina]TQV71971.1 hypothetical protein FLL45_17245 [Aliikangiella marina]TQV72024.1 hypothetical protein FLL45_17525 [Aliikangiella marina]